ncbi:hypothetical protein [Lactiplantibacillus daowaiensis]|uniref:Glycoside hydrolase family 5 domain-containing protein n=1 Tax=Lactiplantibacillus daowaiensis TaxID=2559918 RepID=A0ABW1RWG3_9LACO|nr:hypothetical protein [Lactiplantibacillus daowaiensis]
MNTKVKRRLFLLIGIFFLFVIVISVYNREKINSKKIAEREAREKVLDGHKPITSKIGNFVWLYGYKKNSSANYDYFKSQIQLAKKTDLKYVVLPMVFKGTYVKNGKFDFKEFDKVMKLVKKYKLKPIIVFSAVSSKDDHMYKTKKQIILKKYGNLVLSAIKRYKNCGVVWQMWNEPNGLFWFNQSTDGNNAALVMDWLKFEKRIFGWVRKYDPKSVFLGGAFGGNYRDASKVMSIALSKGMLKHVDAIANHPYVSENESDNGAPENLLRVNSRSYLESLTNNKKIKKSLKSIPLVTTEFGYSMGKTHQGQWSEREQADYLARGMFILDMMHQPIISLFSLVDVGNTEQWGLYKGTDSAYLSKESGRLIMQLLSNLDGYSFNKRISQNSKRDFILRYSKKNKKDRYVCWTMDSTHTIRVANQDVILSATPQIVYR